MHPAPTNVLLVGGLQTYQDVGSFGAMSTEPPLVSKTRALLQARRGDWPKVAAAADVSYSWLCKFAAGDIPSPGIVKLQSVHDALCLEIDESDGVAA